MTEKRLGIDNATYVIARIGGAVTLFAVYVVLGSSFEEGSARTLYLIGALGWILTTVVVAALRLTDFEWDLRRVLQGALLFDAVSLGLLAAALGGSEDPFYAWFVLEAVLYSAVFRQARAWMYSAVLLVAYVIGHLLGFAAVPEPAVLVFVMGKSLGLIAVGWAVGWLMEEQVEVQTELKEHGEEVAGLNTQLARSIAELRAMAEITELIHSTLDLDTVGPLVLETLQKVIDVPAACIFVIDKVKAQTLFSASKGLESGSQARYGDIDHETGDLSVGEEHFACLELLDHNQMLVVFCAEAQQIDALDNEDRMVLQTVASELVVAVENSRLYKLTRRLAITDELTDLYNYRYLQQRLDDEVGRAKRYGKQLSLLMLDVDDFKAVNDTHGHLAGDAVLAELATVMKSVVREVDVVARYGGEEFSVMLPETDASGAFIVAEKIREAVSMHRFPDEDGERRVHVTVSIGLANMPVHAEDKESLLRAADDALYQAKNTGKDRVRAPRVNLDTLEATSAEGEEAGS